MDEEEEILNDVVQLYPFITKEHEGEFRHCIGWDVNMWYKYIPFLMHPFSRHTVFVYQTILRYLIQKKKIKGKKQFDYEFIVIELWSKAILPFIENFSNERLYRVYEDRDQKIHPRQWIRKGKAEPKGLWDCLFCRLKRPCFLQRGEEECDMSAGSYCHIISGLHFCKKHGKRVLNIEGSRFGIYELFYFTDGRICNNLGVVQIISQSATEVGISPGNLLINN